MRVHWSRDKNETMKQGQEVQKMGCCSDRQNEKPLQANEICDVNFRSITSAPLIRMAYMQFVGYIQFCYHHHNPGNTCLSMQKISLCPFFF